LYAKAIAGIEVLALPFTEVEGRAKLGQNRSDDQVRRALGFLWRRGDPGIDVAIAAILEARPELGAPDFLRGPEGVVLSPRPRADELDDAVALLVDSYWNRDCSPTQIREAHAGSPVWVGARDPDGRLIASARAISDGSKHAWIYDVVVADTHRGRGVGRALLTLLLDHPLVRDATKVHLQTRDAGAFYAPFGFTELGPAQHPRWLRSKSSGADPRSASAGSPPRTSPAPTTACRRD
ncbi:MAG: GNAT family N-acetyltransferase, partial [Myxococcales bacterium]|nr:GNAT family N-acetyltransferase [Myxococcales bacterium]